ncbi:MAG TPA: bifunctional DNA-binding transcriptional regulator/O6-methylguanine-DNA methyltransferase Ada [Candidatus Angelobacter sp.]|nr:bifunctional DNA-binding transcriptional regulator/O6-methylguanine-DNA methyltransferase Ada [Candidatus Angelobacter sp.]
MLSTMHTADKWTQVLARDAKADGAFVYAVKSTGIVCRPSCPSRRPKRELVEFFDSVDAAKKAGYRPCKRCVPGQQSIQSRTIQEACRYIDRNFDAPLSLKRIADHVSLSPFHLQRLFKRTLGISPRQYQQAHRANKFKSSLKTEMRITDAIYEAGYGSSSRLYENSSAQLGMTPSAFRRNGEGVAIRYTIVATKLGKALIASTERGLCAVQFGESDASLERGLKAEFTAAQITRDDQALKPLATQIEKFLEGARLSFDMPLDVQGTAFQQLVWKALQNIPYGETRSYAEIAKEIGKPEAVRAVANACASNRAALVIPCHRVVQKSGKLAGYRWGVERKQALLETEQITNRRHPDGLHARQRG